MKFDLNATEDFSTVYSLECPESQPLPDIKRLDNIVRSDSFLKPTAMKGKSKSRSDGGAATRVVAQRSSLLPPLHLSTASLILIIFSTCRRSRLRRLKMFSQDEY